MNLAKIQVSGVRAVATEALREIPAGIVGATVELEYIDSIWAGLNKAVIFRGNTTKEVLTNETTVQVPPEVLAKPMGRLRVGIYGTDMENNVIMPTLWAELGVIAESAEPSVPADSSLPIWAQLWGMIGNLGNLDTAAKNNLVAALNELAAKIGTADPEEIQKIVEEYLKENMPEVDLSGVVKSVNGKTPDANGNVEIEVSGGNVDLTGYATEQFVRDGYQPKGDYLESTELSTAINTALAQAKETGEFDGPAGPQGPQGETGAQGPQGIPGGDYVLTDTDKTEIAEMAAELVDVPSDEHINSLINTALGVIENGTY